MSGKINQRLEPAPAQRAGTPGEGGEPGRGPHHPPNAPGRFAGNREGGEKEREKKEVKTALLLATGSKRLPRLISSFFAIKCCGAGGARRGRWAREPGEPQPSRAKHPLPFQGRQQPAGSRHPGLRRSLLQSKTCSDGTELPSHRAPTKPPHGCRGRAPLPPVCVGKGTPGQGLPGRGAVGPGGSLGAEATGSQLLRAPRRGQPGSCASPAFPHFQEPAFNTAAATQGAGGGSCKKTSKPACFTHCNTGVRNRAEKKAWQK